MKTKTTKVKKEKKVKSTVVSNPLEAVVYNQKGKESEKISLPAEIFGVKWNSDLVHQVAMSMMSNARAGTADARDRSRVSGGGRKPWKQKGTGRARHGSSRSPIWKGGGVTHGPKAEKVYNKKINKKMRTKALFTVLSKKFTDGQILFIDNLTMPEIKTKSASVILNNLSKISGFERLIGSRKIVAHIATFGKDANTVKSFANIPYVILDDVKNINPVEILSHKYLIISNPSEALEFFSKKLEMRKNS